MPPTNFHVKNYLKGHEGLKKCRARFNSEIKAGRMIGGRGWSRETVKDFLGRTFYTIPCGAVPKNQDPFGRIIHDYSSPSAEKNSVNSALINTTVEYISFIERAKKLSKVD